MIPYVVSGGTLTVYTGDKPVQLTSDHPNFHAILARLKENEDPTPLFDPDKALREYFGFNPEARLTRTYLQLVMDAGYPRMRDVVNKARNNPLRTYEPCPNWPLGSAGDCVHLRTYNAHDGDIDVSDYGLIKSTKPHPVDDAVVFEQIVTLFIDEDNYFNVVTNYRTLQIDRVMLLNRDPRDLTIVEGGRYVRGDNVEFSIDYLRQQARSFIK